MARKALELGYVNEVFESQEQMLAHVFELAKEIASKSPLAVHGSKVMINYARDHTLKDGLDYIALWQAGLGGGPQMGEAFRAKAEKRPATFPDLAPLRQGM